MAKIRVAFIKFGGMGIGGTELRLQTMAMHLPPDLYDVHYYYCDAAPYIGSDYRHADTNAERLKIMQGSHVKIIKFNVKAKDVTTPTHDWVDTNFWDVFDENQYDIIQAGKAGHQEYPFHFLRKPVVELVGLAWAGVDVSPNIAWTIHSSPWQWGEWYRRGGRIERVCAIPNPALQPKTSDNFRRELGIGPHDRVAGLIQRADDSIFSAIPLNAFSHLQQPNHHFVIMNGSPRYKDQARQLNLKNVHFIPASGHDDVVSTFFNTLDFFAHGRRDGETYGTVFAEALAHGKPCLSHYVKNGANAQQETMGPCGFFALDEADYIQKMRVLFSDPALCARMASKARMLAEEAYSLEKGMEDLKAIYKKVLDPTALLAEPRLTYGLSPLGFNYAGRIGKPGEIVNHVITGTIPEEADVHLVRFFIPHIQTFIDIGANTGLYGFAAAHFGGSNIRVWMFEPQTDCCEQMEKTIWLNNWEEKVTVVPMALGRQKEELALHLSGTGSTFNHDFVDRAQMPETRVPVDSLSHQCDILKIPKVDFIKIDTEGFEQNVLEGSEAIIKRDKPILFVEIADHLRGRHYKNPHYADTLQWLKDHGYTIWRSTEEGTLEHAFPIRSQHHLSMYLALHKDAAIEIKPLQRWMFHYRWRKRWSKIKKTMRLALRAARHPQNAYSALWRYRNTPSEGLRF